MSELDVALSLASQYRDTRYTYIACAVVLMWDTFVTLSDEIDFIWKRVPRIGIIPCIYLINKYISIATLILGIYHFSELRAPLTIEVIVRLLRRWSNRHIANGFDSCYVYLSSATFIQVFTEILSKFILTTRIIALYNNDRWVKCSLWTLFFISYLLCFSIAVVATRFNLGHAYVSPIGGVCAVTDAPKFFALIFIFPLVYELYMTFLTLRKAVGHAYALRHASSAPLLHVLYVEKMLYFVAITAIRLALVTFVFSARNIYLGLALLWALDVVLVSRFYLEMVAISAKGYRHTSLWTAWEANQREHREISIFARPPTIILDEPPP
ncbi:hypothetical protein M408DRAFT_26127 [Serendipita vermifera MAFF 305830]|uniref:DUF6533 domain-containing protein n=1 Tax=Serendipita vermifera MAFF 305830 TaxID=933852 RepID=A0A0C3B020_SERVB|nr:hypothetical protein M408DRAFT_26127 [Serendipita vermifera MAFF 305830]